ncbi:MAG: ParB/RepB/Spo0J family partition protein [Clostridia bacterium]|nr:ParB/RepB/Spo0J family partition protein [Clostridia bacterium]
MNDGKLLRIRVDEIFPSSDQPRKNFDPLELERLAESINTSGIIQPLLVREGKSGKYELIAGERRLRAAKLLGLKRVPCIIKHTDNLTAAYLTIIENLQRKDLSIFEEAQGLSRLITVYGLTQCEVAQQLGLAQSTLSNKLRLLRLDPKIRERIEAARLTERHARALLRLPSELRDEALNVIIAKQMTLSEAEEYIDKLLNPPEVKPEPVRKAAIGDVRLFSNSLAKMVATMRNSGVNAITEQKETDTFIEYKVLISKAQ